MKRMKLLGLVLIAVFALSAVVSAVASAEIRPNLLPVTAKVNLKNVGNTKLETMAENGFPALAVECKKLKGSGAGNGTDGTSGTVTLEFEECENPVLKTKCTGLNAGEATGNIKVESAEFKLRYLLPAAGSGVNIAISLTNKHVHFSCSLVLVLVLGCASSKDIPETLTAGFNVEFLQTAGLQEPKAIDNVAQTGMEACELEAMTGANEYVKAGQLGTVKLEAVEPTDILIMA
jgi:hypothetical protein